MNTRNDTVTLIEINWTSGNLDEARRVCRYLVQERLVACAQIIPWTESIYLWNNQLETAQESKIVMKTRLENFDKVQRVILENTSYEIPEITYKCYDGSFDAYAKWVIESTPPQFASEKIVEKNV